jgi:hypothetical protein
LNIPLGTTPSVKGAMQATFSGTDTSIAYTCRINDDEMETLLRNEEVLSDSEYESVVSRSNPLEVENPLT